MGVNNTKNQHKHGFLRLFLKRREGATAVEFALIAAPFFFLLFAILEVTVVFFVNTSMEHATMEVARTIRTGEAQTAGQSSGDFLKAVCKEMNSLIPCNGNVYIDVRTFKDFSNVKDNSPIKKGKLDSSSFQYDPGKAGDIILVRVFYTWQLNTPGITNVFANLNGNKRLIEASVAFRNEPFGG